MELTIEQKEALKQASELFKRIWNDIKIVINKVIDMFSKFLKILCKVPGYKRIAKAKELNYFKSIAKGKSNNWRKIHGFGVLRKKQMR